MEICLILDVAKFWGQQLLFRQGQTGQAFYSILSGRVQMWVKENASDSSSVEVEELGFMTNLLSNGNTFGDGWELSKQQNGKELNVDEDTTLSRQFSVMTGDETTYLLVIDRNEFEALLPVIQDSKDMDKLTLLRSPFRSAYFFLQRKLSNHILCLAKKKLSSC
jgi:CRP-like cAMP-binding protein